MKTIKKRKTAKRKTAKKLMPKKRKSKKIWQAHLNAMEKKVATAFNQLKKDVKRNAPVHIIKKDNNSLLMLLGECNYIVREFHSHVKNYKRK